MAIYGFSAQVIGRSAGRSSVAAAAYRAGEVLTDARTGLIHDFSRKRGCLHAEIIAPANTPEWMLDRAALWNGVEAAEKRRDAQLAREIVLSLPHELDHARRLDLVRGFVRATFVDRGMIADVSLHAPDPRGDARNHHAHVMLTLRELTGQGFGPKARDWNRTELLESWRADWAMAANRALERAGHTARIDHRSLADQGLDREPEPKQGPVATDMERQGRPSHAGADRRAAQERNAGREALATEAMVIDLDLARARRAGDGTRPLTTAAPQAAAMTASLNRQVTAAVEASARSDGAGQSGEGQGGGGARPARAAPDGADADQTGQHRAAQARAAQTGTGVGQSPAPGGWKGPARGTSAPSAVTWARSAPAAPGQPEHRPAIPGTRQPAAKTSGRDDHMQARSAPAAPGQRGADTHQPVPKVTRREDRAALGREREESRPVRGSTADPRQNDAPTAANRTARAEALGRLPGQYDPDPAARRAAAQRAAARLLDLAREQGDRNRDDDLDRHHRMKGPGRR